MKAIKSMNLTELAAFVCSHLGKNGIRVVLSGGACVSIYSENRYQSYDLDFIENIPNTRNKLKKAMEGIGFSEHHRYFRNPETPLFVEFPPGPLTVGDEPAGKPATIMVETGMLTLLSPMDCIKDRLAGYFHWRDLQCLEQAVLVGERHAVDIGELRRWSGNEGKGDAFEAIAGRFAGKKSRGRSKTPGLVVTDVKRPLRTP